MCVLCGEIVTNVHWTDRNRNGEEDSGTAAKGDLLRIRRRIRLKRSVMANRILDSVGLKLEEWSGSMFVLRDSKGNSAMVQDLGHLWSAVEGMLKRKLDPLDEGFLERFRELEQKRRE